MFQKVICNLIENERIFMKMLNAYCTYAGFMNSKQIRTGDLTVILGQKNNYVET